MGLLKWLSKKGAVGGTARTIIRQYIELSEMQPDMSQREIFENILTVRSTIPYDEQQTAVLNSMMTEIAELDEFEAKGRIFISSDNLFLFILTIVLVEARVAPDELPESARRAYAEVIIEEMSAAGFETPPMLNSNAEPL